MQSQVHQHDEVKTTLSSEILFQNGPTSFKQFSIPKSNSVEAENHIHEKNDYADCHSAWVVFTDGESDVYAHIPACEQVGDSY